jgi:hypothetical protein
MQVSQMDMSLTHISVEEHASLSEELRAVSPAIACI